jgi:hypothetical protein
MDFWAGLRYSNFRNHDKIQIKGEKKWLLQSTSIIQVKMEMQENL